MESQNISTENVKPKFTLHNSKLQAYAESAIKKSNVKSFIHHATTGSEKVNLQNNQNANLSQHLMQLKNSCNGLKQDIVNKQNQSSRLKDQAGYTSQKVKVLQLERQALQKEIVNLKTNVEQVHQKKLAAMHGFKTYQHILWRMKKDEINNQIKKNALNKQVSLLEKQIKELYNKNYALGELQQLSFNGLKQANQQMEAQFENRKQKIGEMGSKLEQKKVADSKKQQRQNQTQIIQQMAAGDLQDAELIRMKKFLQVQQFLKHLLKDKMQRLKQFYEPYQMAFLQIKSKTSAKDASSLKAQFFNFETHYSQRTAWIKHLQEQISQLQSERKNLKEELVKIKQTQNEIVEQAEIARTQVSGQCQESQNRQTIIERVVENQVALMNIKEWTNFQKKRLGLTKSSQSASQNFVQICKWLINKKQAQKAEKSPVQVEKV